MRKETKEANRRVQTRSKNPATLRTKMAASLDDARRLARRRALDAMRVVGQCANEWHESPLDGQERMECARKTEEFFRRCRAEDVQDHKLALESYMRKSERLFAALASEKEAVWTAKDRLKRAGEYVDKLIEAVGAMHEKEEAAQAEAIEALRRSAAQQGDEKPKHKAAKEARKNRIPPPPMLSLRDDDEDSESSCTDLDEVVQALACERSDEERESGAKKNGKANSSLASADASHAEARTHGSRGIVVGRRSPRAEHHTGKTRREAETSLAAAQVSGS